MYKLTIKEYSKKPESRFVFTFIFENKYEQIISEFILPYYKYNETIINELFDVINKLKNLKDITENKLYDIENFSKYFTTNYSEFSEELGLWKIPYASDYNCHFLTLDECEVCFYNDENVRFECEITRT